MVDHLTIPLSPADVQGLLYSALPDEQEHIQHHAVQLAQQLLATMQENARLREALEHYRHADDGVFRMLAGFNARSDMRDPNSIAGKALDFPSEYQGKAEQPPTRGKEVKMGIESNEEPGYDPIRSDGA